MKIPSKKELIKLQRVDNLDTVYDAVLIVPTGRKHESGYMKIAVIGIIKQNTGEPIYELRGEPDDINWITPESYKYGDGYALATLRMDCYYPRGIIHVWGHGEFKIGIGYSSQDIRFIAK